MVDHSDAVKRPGPGPCIGSATAPGDEARYRSNSTLGDDRGSYGQSPRHT
jgi:hypothetical protein